MPPFVVIISLLSLMSFSYSMTLLNQEIHRLQLVTQPFGGTVERLAEQVLRLTLSLVLAATSLVALGISIALVWLVLQPSVVG